VIGGLLVSTILSLLFVPALFTIMDDFGNLWGRVFGRFIGKADEPKPPHSTLIPVSGTHGELIAARSVHEKPPDEVVPALASFGKGTHTA
jgi:hypothetical protein